MAESFENAFLMSFDINTKEELRDMLRLLNKKWLIFYLEGASAWIFFDCTFPKHHWPETVLDPGLCRLAMSSCSFLGNFNVRFFSTRT